MRENQEERGLSRRELLKKSLVATGYVAPALMLLKMGSLNAWACSYGGRPISPKPSPRYGRRYR